MNKLATVVIVLALGAAAASLWRSGRAPLVEVATPRRGPAVQAVYATGTVEPTVMMPIAARFTARLMQLNADEGSTVIKGAVLAQLEDSHLAQRLLELKAREEFAQREFHRNQQLFRQDAVAREALERTRADWEAAAAAVRAAKAELGYLSLVAPEDGLIIRRDGEVGQLIPANQPVFWLSCCAALRVSAEVDEEDIPNVAPDQEVLVRADAFPGEVFQGKVLSITPKGDPISRSYRVRVSLPENTPLRIGMTAETNIIVRRTEEALLLPSAAVNAQGTVWTVEDGSLKRRAVRVGASGPQYTEILDGIEPSSVVVLKRPVALQEGAAVRTEYRNTD